MDRDRYHFVAFSAIAVIAIVLSTAISQTARSASSLELPSQLSGLVMATLTTTEIGVLKTGQPVSKLLTTSVDSEVGVLGATWIDAPVDQYVQALEDIEQFENGGSFEVTKRISDPPVIADFAALQLRQEDIADLKKCRVGNCELKIGADAISHFRSKIHWSKSTAISDVRALFRQLALQYVVDYQRGGNAELEVYRDKHRPNSVAKEFAAIVDEMPEMLRYDPSLRQYLLDYPNAQLSNGTSFFYWQQVNFGLKPTVRINHVAISQAGQNTLIASKLVYANHYFRAALELQLLMPDPSRGPGFWLVSVKRMRSDGLNGTGNLVRGRVEKEAVRGLSEALRATKLKFESDRQQQPPGL
jgi:hypothetical protein